MNCQAPTSIARLHERLSYNPDTGILTWKTDGNGKLAGTTAGNLNQRGYLRFNLDNRSIQSHRAAWALFYDAWPELDLDHINRVKTDNRICNLRLATQAQNNANRGALRSNTHGTQGITRLPSGKWQAQIQFKGKNHYLGAFKEKLDAVAAYAAAAQRFFGAFAPVGVKP